MKILIVEDEPKTGEYLRQGLGEAGFVVDLAQNGIDGLHLARQGTYDLVILDVMLPGLNGWQVLQSMRKHDLQMPAMFLTARDQVEDRVKGLELGADDYLVKPFSFAELLARVRTILRRGRNGRRRQICGTRLAHADQPPRVTGTRAPVTARAADEARNRITSATAAGWTHCETSASGMSLRLVGVSMMLGRTALTVTLVPASSSANASVMRWTPDLDAA